MVTDVPGVALSGGNGGRPTILFHYATEIMTWITYHKDDIGCTTNTLYTVEYANIFCFILGGGVGGARKESNRKKGNRKESNSFR